MKRYFKFSLSGSELFGLYIAFYLLFVASYGGLFWAVGRLEKGAAAPVRELAALFLCIAGLLLVYFVFTILFSRKLVPALSLDDFPFKFERSLIRFLGMNAAGVLLSTVTLGVYAPWYAAKVMRYYTAGVSYKGKALEFRGKGKRLFVILLLTLCIPIAILTVLALTVLKPIAGKPYYQAVVQVITMILLAPYFFMVYQWVVDFGYGSFSIRWDTRFMDAVPRILLQMGLTIVTAGIYYPAAYLKLYRYFMSKTVAASDGKTEGAFGFEGEVGEGFLLIWGQLLLTLVTLGIYAPWAICKISARICEKSYYEWR